MREEALRQSAQEQAKLAAEKDRLEMEAMLTGLEVYDLTSGQVERLDGVFDVELFD